MCLTLKDDVAEYIDFPILPVRTALFLGVWAFSIALARMRVQRSHAYLFLWLDVFVAVRFLTGQLPVWYSLPVDHAFRSIMSSI